MCVCFVNWQMSCGSLIFFFCHLLYPTLSLSTCSSHCRSPLIAGARCACGEGGGGAERKERRRKTTIKQRHVAQVHRARSCNKHVASCIQKCCILTGAKRKFEVPAKCFSSKSTAMPKRFVLICRCAYRLAERERDSQRAGQASGKN